MHRRLTLFTLLAALVMTTGMGGGFVRAQSAPVGGEVREVEIPVGRPVSLSPDGTMVVSVDPREAMCVYLVETMAEVSCGDLGAINAPVNFGYVAWSPDSTRIAFAQDAFRLLADSDLRVMEVATGAVTNLTDDGFEDRIFPMEEAVDFFVDVAPSWTPDGSAITFSRSIWVQGEQAGNVIAQIPASGGEVETLAVLSTGRMGIMYAPGAWAPDASTFYFTADSGERDNPGNGIWALDAETGATHQVAGSEDPELGLLMLRAVSPAGDRLLAYYRDLAMQGPTGVPMQRFVDPETGIVSEIPNPLPESETYEGLWFSAFSPDGAYLLQTWGLNGEVAYWVTDLATGASAEVTPVLSQAAPVDAGLGPVWASNGVAGVARDTTGFYTFPIDGVGLAPAASTVTDASPVPASSESDVVVGGEVRQVELPEGRAISMSPDGRYLAVAVPPQESLCVYEVATMAEVSCADLAVLNTSLRVEDVVWSPDSTRLAFSEQTFMTFKDGDLWVMDAASGALTNLTDDGYTAAIALLQDDADDVPFFVDVVPAWTPDSQFITFSRTLSGEGGATSNVIAQVPADGGEVETLAEVSGAPGVFYYRGQWAPDGSVFYYTVMYPDPDDPENGIWAFDPESGASALLATGDDPELGPLMLSEVSATGGQLLAVYPRAVMQGGYLGRSPLRLVDTATGAVSAIPDPLPESEIFEGTWVATFSPDGQYLLQLTGLDRRAAWVTNLATGESTEVATDLESATPIALGLGPVWGTDGTVFVAWNVVGAYFFPIAGAGLETTPSGDATPAPQPAGFAPGETVYTNGMTPLFAAPDAAAAVVGILAPNQVLQILSTPVENEQGVWYPVLDPETQIIGYVQASRLE